MNALQIAAEVASRNENLPMLTVFTLMFPFVMYCIGAGTKRVMESMSRRVLHRD